VTDSPRLRAPVLLACLLLAGCTATPEAPDGPYESQATPAAPASIIDVLPGQWGSDRAQCDVDPQTLSFSDDGRTLHARYRILGTTYEAGKSDKAHYRYRVGAQRGNLLHLELEGETRLDAAGQPVTWELALIDRDTFCWHRNDWPKADACSPPMIRCPG
jgi:hypothetical protein